PSSISTAPTKKSSASPFSSPSNAAAKPRSSTPSNTSSKPLPKPNSKKPSARSFASPVFAWKTLSHNEGNAMHQFASGWKKSYYGKGDVTAYRLTRQGHTDVFGANVLILIYGEPLPHTHTTRDH